MDFIRATLEQQPLMALFLTIAIGHVVGGLVFRGFSIGVGAVLFVALAVGWWVPQAQPSPMVGTLGLALFLYGVGLQYGRQFVLGLTSREGLLSNAIALAGVLCAGAVSVALMGPANMTVGHALGLFAGSGTSTPTLQAAVALLGNDDPAIGYSVTYPFGVAGPILVLYLAYTLLRPSAPVPSVTDLEMLEIVVRNPDYAGKTVAELMAMLPGVRIVALRRKSHNETASPTMAVAVKDVLLATAFRHEDLTHAAALLGEEAHGRFVKDRQDLDYLRVFASRAAVVGRALGDLQVPWKRDSIYLMVRRGDTDLVPRPDLVLEFGDRIGVLAHRDDFAAVRRYFGDSIRGTAEFSFISIGIGMALGFLAGAIPFPLPGAATLSVGLAGVLIVALLLGHFRRTGPLNWTIPFSANLVIRNLGLTLFLAQVGMASGPKFAATVTETSSGLVMMGLGVLVLLAFVAPILVLGLYVFRLPFDEVAGIICGTCGNPAILAYANKLSPSERLDTIFAVIFPSMTIIKILFVDVAPSFF
ncbi:YidE/YbjL duplication [Verrucomicrobia bacterium LW23]|nr:YidE/YbjL duplication [Verrucomicrobia bacterium LW23]